MPNDHMQRQRFEHKYMLDEHQARAIRKELLAHLDLDENGVGKPDYSYPVHSLYLDSGALETFWATIDGDRNRYKLRLRFYNDQPDSSVFFEIKRRVNNCILKQRAGVRKAAVPWLLVGALLKSLSAMGYVSILLALLFYIYAVAGVNLFGRTDPGHFGSLGTALLSLFRIVTLDNWGEIYLAQVAHVPEVKVAVYFTTFIVFGTMIILNLFIGIILNSMSEAHEEQARQSAKAAETNAPTEGVLARLDHTTKQLAELQTALAGLRKELQASSATPVVAVKSSCPSNPSSPSTQSPPLSSCRAC